MGYYSTRLLTLVILSISFLLTNCTSMQKTAQYDIGLEQVERPADFQKRYGKSEITKQDTAEISRYVYSDSLMSIAWLPYPQQFEFVLQNKSDHTMKVIWNEAAFVDSNGGTHPVMHQGVKFSDKNNPMPPSVVISGGNLSDLIYPSDYISWGYNSWIEKGIFEPISAMSVSKLQPAKEHEGKTVKVLLPLEIEGTVNEYIFTFKVNDVELPNVNESNNY